MMPSFFTSFVAVSGTVLALHTYGVFPTIDIVNFLKTPTIMKLIRPKPFLLSLPTIPMFDSPPQEIPLADLLTHSHEYHQQLVSIRGIITQPELHLDDTELYIDFVFRLSQDTHSLIVYGRHNRTLGAPVIQMNQSVEVIGTFFEEQERAGSVLHHVLEAISVMPYPSSVPEST